MTSKTRKFRAAAIFLRMAAILLVAGLLPVRAQKAEPVRIRFARGATAATVKGVLRDRQQKEYALEAREGQKMELHLHSSPHGSSAVKVYAPNGSEIRVETVGANLWRIVLHETGEFVMIVRRTTDKRGRSAFSLRVDVR
jgi:hypothetical protein